MVRTKAVLFLLAVKHHHIAQRRFQDVCVLRVAVCERNTHCWSSVIDGRKGKTVLRRKKDAV